MPTIFDLVQSQEIVSYWETMTQERDPYLGETLFPNDSKLGLDLKWLKGSSGLPVVLKPSAFDAASVLRPRLGFDKLSAEMPFFKESMAIDETLRQELNMVLETGNTTYIDAVMNRVFKDDTTLLEAAAARREQMRMMMLTTGAISITANGQNYDFDYGVPANHKKTVLSSWADSSTSIISDIREWQDTVEDDTGVRPSRAVCSRKTWGYLLKNTEIRNAILGNSSAAPVSDAKLTQYLLDELKLDVAVYTKKYKNEAGVATQYVADDVFVLFPEGELGNTWFGTTPEQSDLMASQVANVTITDTGVAVTTMQKADPVNVETKVTMICLPDFPTADQVFIADVTP